MLYTNILNIYYFCVYSFAMLENKDQQDIIHVDAEKPTPIYRQIIQSIELAIENGKLTKGDLVPSVNATAAQFNIARGSIFKAYNHLRTEGIIDSIPGKGYFVISTKQSKKKNIFLLLSTYNPYREVFYNALIKTLKNQATVDIYFHHHNIDVFETLINSHSSHYNTFVIMPENHTRSEKILKSLDQKQLYILETGLSKFGDQYAGIYQNYRKDIYDFLSGIKERLVSYKRIILLFSSNMRNYEVITGFQDFSNEHTEYSMEVIQETETFLPKRGDLCLVMDDNDLVRLILYSRENKNWTLGSEIGLISYHETPLKSIIGNGISTISPDFEQMGKAMASLLIKNGNWVKENAFRLIDRGSF